VDGQKLVVTCPWSHEHSGKNTSGTFVDDTEDRMGHFVCAHQHCGKRHSLEALDALRGLPAVAAELSMWPEPRNILEPYTRLEKAPDPAPEVAKPATPGWLTWADLMAPLPPIQWLCQDLQLCPGRPAAVVAEPNAGKTWSLQAMALAVATGRPIFGKFAADQGPVLHVSTDAGEYATRWRYQMLARGMGIDARELPIKVWPGRLKCVNKYQAFDPAGLAPIVEEAQRGGYKLVILDSLFAIAAGLDMNSPEAAEPLWYSKNLGGTWLWAMHSPKGKPGFFGSQAIAAACGAMWNMNLAKDADGRPITDAPRLWSLGRKVEEHDGRGPEEFATQWDRDVDGSGRLTGARIVLVDAQTIQDDTLEVSPGQQMQYDMLTHIHRLGSASYADLLTAAGAPPGTTGRTKRRAVQVVGALAQAGLIVSTHGTNYIPAAGTVPPAAAHRVIELVRLGHA
jgi:hypothetical protein